MNLKPLLALGTATVLAFTTSSALAQSAGTDAANGATKATAIEKDPKAKARAKAESLKLSAAERQGARSVVPTGTAAAIDSATGSERSYKTCHGKEADL